MNKFGNALLVLKDSLFIFTSHSLRNLGSSGNLKVLTLDFELYLQFMAAHKKEKHVFFFRSKPLIMTSNFKTKVIFFYYYFPAICQPRSQGPLSTSRKYPGYGWSRVYTCQLQTHRGWVLNKLQLQLQLSSPSLRSYLWNLLKSSKRVTSRNQGTFSR